MLGNFLCFRDLLTFFKINFLKKIGGGGGGGGDGGGGCGGGDNE